MDQIKGGSSSGQPSTYTILGDTFRFAPTPSSAYTGYLNYYQRFSALSDSNTSNFILTNHPAIYLYGSLYHAANFLGGVDPQRLQQWQRMYETAMERLERNDREDQYGSAPGFKYSGWSGSHSPKGICILLLLVVVTYRNKIIIKRTGYGYI